MSAILSREAYEKLRQELHELKTKGRQNMAAAIQEAREKGDLSENAEYDAAKEAQGLMEMKINELEGLLSSAKVLESSQIDTSRVQPLTWVKIKNCKTGIVMKYNMVSEKEADVKLGKISMTSPIGAGLMNKKIGDVVDVTVPSGSIQLEVLEITAE